MRMAERFGEKSNWALLDHLVKIVIIPVGVWSILAMLSLKESVIELKSTVVEMQKTVAQSVSQPQYTSDSRSIERRLDNAEQDIKQIRADMRKD